MVKDIKLKSIMKAFALGLVATIATTFMGTKDTSVGMGTLDNI